MGEASLHIAAGTGHVDMVKALLPHINVEQMTKVDRTPLAYGISYKQLHVVKYLIQSHPISAYKSYPKIVYSLLEAGIDSGDFEMLEYLVTKVPDITVPKEVSTTISYTYTFLINLLFIYL